MPAEPLTRSAQLLDAAANALLAGRDPFDHAFLVEHSVTGEECSTLSDLFGLLAKAYLRASPKLRQMIVVLGATHDASIDPRVLEEMILGRQTKKALSATNARQVQKKA